MFIFTPIKKISIFEIMDYLSQFYGLNKSTIFIKILLHDIRLDSSLHSDFDRFRPASVLKSVIIKVNVYLY